MTGTNAHEILVAEMKTLEASGDIRTATELAKVASFTGPFATQEFMDLPLAGKCEKWRALGFSDGFRVTCR